MIVSQYNRNSLGEEIMTILPFGQGNGGDIKIYRHCKGLEPGEGFEVKVNWPSIGSVHREDVETFAEALSEAAKIADIAEQHTLAEAAIEVGFWEVEGMAARYEKRKEQAA